MNITKNELLHWASICSFAMKKADVLQESSVPFLLCLLRESLKQISLLSHNSCLIMDGNVKEKFLCICSSKTYIMPSNGNAGGYYYGLYNTKLLPLKGETTMTKFETIGVNRQYSAYDKANAQKQFTISCNCCCAKGMRINCDSCAIAYTHSLVNAYFDEKEKETN